MGRQQAWFPAGELGRGGLEGEQRGIDSPCPLERFGVDEDVNEGIEACYRGPTAHLRSLNAQCFGLTVDTLRTGALAVDALVERPISVQHDAHEPTGLDVEVFDAAFLFEKLLMLAGLPRGLRKEQGAPIALGTIALGMLELIRRLHAQAHGTVRDAIGVTLKAGMAMRIQGNGRDAATEGTGLIRLPGIEGGISSDVEGKEA